MLCHRLVYAVYHLRTLLLCSLLTINCFLFQLALNILLDGLRRMEYRGYDSAGVGVISEGKLQVVKKKGKVENLAAACHDPRLATSSIGKWSTLSKNHGHTHAILTSTILLHRHCAH